MTEFSYTLTAPNDKLPTMGLLVLQTDETIEHDFQRLLMPMGIRIFVSRVPSGLEVSKDSLSAMANALPHAADLFPKALDLEVVGYGCTSASSVIGADEVARLVRTGCNCTHVSDPLSAVIAACRHLNVCNIAFLSPYVEEVSTALRTSLQAAGINTQEFGSFNEAEETKVAGIDKKSLFDAAVELGQHSSVGAVFLSCTNLKTLDVIAEIEREISKPVLSSNQALAWHMCQLAGIELRLDKFGLLLAGADKNQTSM